MEKVIRVVIQTRYIGQNQCQSAHSVVTRHGEGMTVPKVHEMIPEIQMILCLEDVNNVLMEFGNNDNIQIGRYRKIGAAVDSISGSKQQSSGNVQFARN